ncbi:hypothetical protein [Bizionia arctica]|uniref:Addiction module protein n=1 Tax=Bizionia arctica TaxID=1495645 RepID=A0A917GL12_9FLAO|nr:hypothetical protein [Bizionia arctica]GGG49698.1 hypothetical protein GCM10010976_21270 [Bizionia arctica]
MDIDIENKKIELIQWLSTLTDSATINKLIKLRESEKRDWWKDMSLAERQSIEKGIQDADSGKLNSHSEAKKMYDKWL